jgi:hypothetical protein
MGMEFISPRGERFELEQSEEKNVWTERTNPLTPWRRILHKKLINEA